VARSWTLSGGRAEPRWQAAVKSGGGLRHVQRCVTVAVLRFAFRSWPRQRGKKLISSSKKFGGPLAITTTAKVSASTRSPCIHEICLPRHALATATPRHIPSPVPTLVHNVGSLARPHSGRSAAGTQLAAPEPLAWTSVGHAHPTPCRRAAAPIRPCRTVWMRRRRGHRPTAPHWRRRWVVAFSGPAVPHPPSPRRTSLGRGSHHPRAADAAPSLTSQRSAVGPRRGGYAPPSHHRAGTPSPGGGGGGPDRRPAGAARRPGVRRGLGAGRRRHPPPDPPPPRPPPPGGGGVGDRPAARGDGAAHRGSSVSRRGAAAPPLRPCHAHCPPATGWVFTFSAASPGAWRFQGELWCPENVLVSSLPRLVGRRAFRAAWMTPNGRHLQGGGVCARRRCTPTGARMARDNLGEHGLTVPRWLQAAAPSSTRAGGPRPRSPPTGTRPMRAPPAAGAVAVSVSVSCWRPRRAARTGQPRGGAPPPVPHGRWPRAAAGAAQPAASTATPRGRL